MQIRCSSSTFTPRWMPLPRNRYPSRVTAILFASIKERRLPPLELSTLGHPRQTCISGSPTGTPMSELGAKVAWPGSQLSLIEDSEREGPSSRCSRPSPPPPAPGSRLLSNNRPARRAAQSSSSRRSRARCSPVGHLARSGVLVAGHGAIQSILGLHHRAAATQQESHHDAEKHAAPTQLRLKVRRPTAFLRRSARRNS